MQEYGIGYQYWLIYKKHNDCLFFSLIYKLVLLTVAGNYFRFYKKILGSMVHGNYESNFVVTTITARWLGSTRSNDFVFIFFLSFLIFDQIIRISSRVKGVQSPSPPEFRNQTVWNGSSLITSSVPFTMKFQT